LVPLFFDLERDRDLLLDIDLFVVRFRLIKTTLSRFYLSLEREYERRLDRWLDRLVGDIDSDPLLRLTLTSDARLLLTRLSRDTDLEGLRFLLFSRRSFLFSA
jgi:hypothetical protein